ncbi:hypothetical protein [Clostridium botulinum]|nr:hypothetical protein [Clostridium botulinum]
MYRYLKNYYIFKLDNKWGIIDTNNKIVKNFEYDDVAVVELEKDSKT